MDANENETSFTPEQKEAVVNYNLSYFGVDMLRAMNDTVVKYGNMLDKGQGNLELTVEVLEACLVTFAHVRDVIDIIGKPLIKPMEEAGWTIEQQKAIGKLMSSDPRIERLDMLMKEDVNGYKERWAKEQGEKLMQGLSDLLKRSNSSDPSSN